MYTNATNLLNRETSLQGKLFQKHKFVRLTPLVPKNTTTSNDLIFKEARAGCGLKNRLCDIHYILHLLFQVYLCGENISYRDCSETGAISKYVFNIDLFV